MERLIRELTLALPKLEAYTLAQDKIVDAFFDKTDDPEELEEFAEAEENAYIAAVVFERAEFLLEEIQNLFEDGKV